VINADEFFVIWDTNANGGVYQVSGRVLTFHKSSGNLDTGNRGPEFTVNSKPLPVPTSELRKAMARGPGGQIIVTYLSIVPAPQAAVIYVANMDPSGVKSRNFFWK
jgi:hypothetical protein